VFENAGVGEILSKGLDKGMRRHALGMRQVLRRGCHPSGLQMHPRKMNVDKRSEWLQECAGVTPLRFSMPWP